MLNKRSAYLTRDTVLNLSSDDEVARQGSGETAACLEERHEYVGLDSPERGVQLARHKNAFPMGRVLPKKAVDEQTWHEVVVLLAAHGITERAHPGFAESQSVLQNARLKQALEPVPSNARGMARALASQVLPPSSRASRKQESK